MVGTPRRKKVQVDVKKQLDELKQELLKEFGELLAQALQGMPVAPQLQRTMEKLNTHFDEPIFIPAKITSDSDQQITVKEDEADGSNLGDAAEALRRAKEKENERGEETD